MSRKDIGRDEEVAYLDAAPPGCRARIMMCIMQGLRAYRAVLGLLVIAAFLTGELGTIHTVLGYAIAGIIGGRLVAALSGLRQLGLSRFCPQFDGLTLGNALTHPAISKTLLAGIAACLILATATGSPWIAAERSVW